jgi:uncharacterized membrane protein YadS
MSTTDTDHEMDKAEKTMRAALVEAARILIVIFPVIWVGLNFTVSERHGIWEWAEYPPVPWYTIILGIIAVRLTLRWPR